MQFFLKYGHKLSGFPKKRKWEFNKEQKFLQGNDQANFAAQDTVSQNGDVKPLDDKLKYQTDKSFNELGIVSIKDTCDSSIQEGTS